MVIMTDTVTMETVTKDTPFGPVTFQYSKFTTTLQTEVRDNRVFTIGPTTVTRLGMAPPHTKIPQVLTQMPKNSLHDYKEYYQLFYNMSSHSQHRGPHFSNIYNAAQNWERGQAKLLKKELLAVPTFSITVPTGSPDGSLETLSFTHQELSDKVDEMINVLSRSEEKYVLSPSTGGARAVALGKIKRDAYVSEYNRVVFGKGGEGKTREELVNAIMANSGAVSDVTVTTLGETFTVPKARIDTQTAMVEKVNRKLGVSDTVNIPGLGGSVVQKKEEAYFSTEKEGPGGEIEEVISEEVETMEWLKKYLPGSKTLGIVAAAGVLITLLYVGIRRRK